MRACQRKEREDMSVKQNRNLIVYLCALILTAAAGAGGFFIGKTHPANSFKRRGIQYSSQQK